MLKPQTVHIRDPGDAQQADGAKMMDSSRLQNPSLLSTKKGRDEARLKAGSGLRIKALQHITKGSKMEKPVFVQRNGSWGFRSIWHSVC